MILTFKRINNMLKMLKASYFVFYVVFVLHSLLLIMGFISTSNSYISVYLIYLSVHVLFLFLIAIAKKSNQNNVNLENNFKYSAKKDEHLKIREQKIFEELNKIAKKYEPQFDKYNCKLNLNLYWINSKSQIFYSRIPFDNDYMSCVSCSVETNIIQNKDKFKKLSENWVLVSISRFLFQLDVSIWDDSKEFERKLICFLHDINEQ